MLSPLSLLSTSERETALGRGPGGQEGQAPVRRPPKPCLMKPVPAWADFSLDRGKFSTARPEALLGVTGRPVGSL